MTDDQANSIILGIRFSEFENGFPEAESLSSAGVVLLCCEVAPTIPGETRAEILALYNAKNNALEVAKGLLNQKWDCKSRLYARIGIIPDAEQRNLAHQALSHLYRRGKQ